MGRSNVRKSFRLFFDFGVFFEFLKVANCQRMKAGRTFRQNTLENNLGQGTSLLNLVPLKFQHSYPIPDDVEMITDNHIE